ncbi:MAG: hypothetical protein CME62_06235 [Halobacteriovoraceae bacterium]|nr:hypothetical protein [Halobacteriovoraceae bacterium]|tara:strand:- start:4566 stop:4943 length:378 start_codon:yes stop_codon:yes gene_type:complete
MKPAILYDSFCKICDAEVMYYKKKDEQNVFAYIDIMNPNFDPTQYALTKKEVHKYFHVIDEKGHIHRGVDAFYLIWKKLDRFKLLQAIYHSSFGKAFMKIGYKGFVMVRPYLPRKKHCEDGYCEL